jgi:adenosylcobinamide kinase/adenosylcobinamide-phosphate guanylyltransferase
MLWLITGGVGCGKSAFAEDLALTLGREGIRLSCPPFPQQLPQVRPFESESHPEFPWTISEADETLADKLNAINLESNIFRADRRVLVIDSLSGWLRATFHRVPVDVPDAEARIDANWQEVLTAILSFQGKMIVITEDTSAGLSLSLQEQLYLYKLAEANRKLFEASCILYRITAGMATEVKGYRVKRRNLAHENIYTDR